MLKDSGRIAAELVVHRHDREIVMKGLTNQHAIERVTVVGWDRKKPRDRFDLQGQNRNPVSDAPLVEVCISRLG